MSWSREIRPTPIAATLMRLPGDVLPKTVAGTMAGAAPSRDAAAAPLPVEARKERRDTGRVWT